MDSSTRPNFVIVVADQLRADAVGAFGSKTASTPNYDALAQRGSKFTNAFVQHTVCSPSRASFLTGWYPHVRGHRSLTHLLRPEDPNLLKTLKTAGYHVVHAGARGDTWAPGATEASCDQYGWDEPPKMGADKSRLTPDDPMSRAFYVGLSEQPYDFDEACTVTAERWLQNRPTDKPWVLYAPLIFPHCPFAVTEPWFSMHDRTNVGPRRPPVVTGHEPAYMANLRRLYGTDRLSDQQWAEIAATYHGMVSRFDSHLGRIVDAVGDALSNTVVVVFSDHGEYLGDYDLIEKWPSGMHDCLARDPLVMAGPGIPQGRTVDDMVELIDIVPTIYELAGVEPDYSHFGRSLLPVLADPDVGHRQFAFTEGGFLVEEEPLLERPAFPYDLKGQAQHESPHDVGKAVCIRSREWTYVWRLYEPPELYDRTNDPDELHNLAGLAQHAEVEAELLAQLMRWLVATGDVLPWQADPRFPRVDLPTPGSGMVS